MSVHLGDEIELYALGDLSAQERAEIEAHLADCDMCTRAVGEAEETLAQMASLLPAFKAPKRSRLRSVWSVPAARIAIAASFVIGLLVAAGTLPFLTLTSRTSSDDVRAQAAMTHSHFVHVELAPVMAGAPAAKVIYARDRSWLYAIVDDGHSAYRLVSIGNSGAPHDLGTLVSHGETASLFADHPPSGDTVELVSGDRIIA
ncbi:MAG: zf-HC2 domain-containing protein, partial [Polyangiaceae bacterium]